MTFASVGNTTPHRARSRSPGASLEAQPDPETVVVKRISCSGGTVFIGYFIRTSRLDSIIARPLVLKSRFSASSANCSRLMKSEAFFSSPAADAAHGVFDETSNRGILGLKETEINHLGQLRPTIED